MKTMTLVCVLAAAMGVACGDDGAGGSGGDASGGNASTGGNGSGGDASGGASGGTGGAQSAFAEYCDARAALCQSDAVACKTQESCALGFLRNDIEVSLLDCLATDCNEEKCLANAATNPTAAALAAKTKCLEKRAACQASDDICFSLPILDDALVQDFADCLDIVDCNALGQCISDQTDTLNQCEDWL